MIPLSNNIPGFFYDFSMSTLPYANFGIFNRIYAPIPDGCNTCHGTGGFIITAYQGDPPQGGLVYFFESCNDCIGSELCPGCMQPLALSFDLSAFESKVIHVNAQPERYLFAYDTNTFSYEQTLQLIPFEGFTCICCGWQYDPNINGNDYDKPDYDDGDYDYPALDASDYFLF